MQEIEIGQPIKHKSKRLYDATFWKWSKSGKRIGVRHNIAHPYGVVWGISWYNHDSIEIQ